MGRRDLRQPRSQQTLLAASRPNMARCPCDQGSPRPAGQRPPPLPLQAASRLGAASEDVALPPLPMLQGVGNRGVATFPRASNDRAWAVEGAAASGPRGQPRELQPVALAATEGGAASGTPRVVGSSCG
ncbi:hypothetical protein Dimus_022283 [Dionaea muscipula]